MVIIKRLEKVRCFCSLKHYRRLRNIYISNQHRLKVVDPLCQYSSCFRQILSVNIIVQKFTNKNGFRIHVQTFDSQLDGQIVGSVVIAADARERSKVRRSDEGYVQHGHVRIFVTLNVRVGDSYAATCTHRDMSVN